jgi:hypothetical protein
MSRRPFATLLAAWMVILISAAWAVPAQEYHRTVPLDAGGRLRVSTYKGTIELIPWDQAKVEVHARIEAPGDVSADYAKAIVAATRLLVTGGDEAVTIEVDYDKVPVEHGWFGFGNSTTLPYAHLKIHAPRRLQLVVDDYKSDLTLSGFEGKLRIKSYKGTLRGGDLSGELVLETYKGEVDFTRVAGRLEAETYKGRIAIEADRLAGRCRLETYKGVIRVAVRSGQPVTVTSDISAKGTLVNHLSASAEAGPARRKEPAGGEPVRLHVETYKGQIRLER